MAADHTDQDADQAHRKAERDLQRSVDKAVPDTEKLPGSFDDNPLSQKVRDTTRQSEPKPGSSTLKGGNEVER